MRRRPVLAAIGLALFLGAALVVARPWGDGQPREATGGPTRVRVAVVRPTTDVASFVVGVDCTRRRPQLAQTCRALAARPIAFTNRPCGPSRRSHELRVIGTIDGRFVSIHRRGVCLPGIPPGALVENSGLERAIAVERGPGARPPEFP